MKPIHVPAADFGLCGYARSLGFPLTLTRQQPVLAFTDTGAMAAPWVARDGVHKLHNRIEQQQIPGVMPSVAAGSDFLSITGPVFIKPADTLTARRASPLAYTEYQSAADAAAALAKRPFAEVASLVVQPSLGIPADILTLDFAVNSAGQVFVFQSMVLSNWSGFNDIYGGESVPAPEEAVRTVCDAVAHYGVKATIHHAQFGLYAGAWRLIDWNPRVSLLYDDGFWDVDGLLLSALSFMTDGQFTASPMPYVQHRNYRDRVVSTGQVAAAKALGFRVRGVHRYCKHQGLDALAWVGDKATADAKFAEFEALL